jgi:hypothetical protein
MNQLALADTLIKMILSADFFEIDIADSDELEQWINSQDERAKIIADWNIDYHTVKMDYDGWIAKHPLQERFDGDLFNCSLTEYDILDLDLDMGIHMIRRDEDGNWKWLGELESSNDEG